MAERKATNKYYPPEWSPSKGSINTFRGQHPLRDRARKLHQGILVIRFELPWNIWCTGCNNHVAKGVRYNAEKKQSGSYLSTKIWRFSMNCHRCPNKIVIETDPQNRDYKIISGASRKVETWSPSANETIEFLSTEQKAKLSEDPFYKLEYTNDDKRRAEKEQPVLEQLLELSQQNNYDDFSASQLLRKKLRTEKKQEKEEGEVNLRKGIGFKLLPETEEDRLRAKMINFQSTRKVTNLSTERKRKLAASIFGGAGGEGVVGGKSKSSENVLLKALKLPSKKNSTGSLFGKIGTSDPIKSVKKKSN